MGRWRKRPATVAPRRDMHLDNSAVHYTAPRTRPHRECLTGGAAAKLARRTLLSVAALAAYSAPAAAQYGPLPAASEPIVATGTTRARPLADHLGDEVRALDFGACTWDSAHDVAPCIQAAINAAAAAGGGEVHIPAGHWPIASTLTITASGVRLHGGGYGILRDNFTPATANSVTSLLWTGIAGGTMLRVAPTPNPTSGVHAWGNGITGILLDGNFMNAGICADIASTSNGLYDFAFAEPGSIGVSINTVSLGEWNDPQDNEFTIFGRALATGSTARGLVLDGTATSGAWNGNTSINHFRNVNVTTTGGDAVQVLASDHNVFDMVSASSAAGRALVFGNGSSSPGGVAYANQINYFVGGTIYALGYQTGSSITRAGSNHGNGTPGALTINTSAVPGSYKLTATSPTQFTVAPPSGGNGGTLVVGTAYAGDFSVTISAGSTAFQAGDSFTVAVPQPSANNHVNFIDRYDSTPLPSAEPGANIYYATDWGAGYNVHFANLAVGQTESGIGMLSAEHDTASLAIISESQNGMDIWNAPVTAYWNVSALNSGDLRIFHSGVGGTLNLGNGAPALVGPYNGPTPSASLTVANGSSNQQVWTTPDGSLQWGAAILAGNVFRITSLAGSNPTINLGNGAPVMIGSFLGGNTGYALTLGPSTNGNEVWSSVDGTAQWGAAVSGGNLQFQRVAGTGTLNLGNGAPVSVSGALSLGGTTTAPTPSTGDNSTKIATTAFVTAALGGPPNLPGGYVAGRYYAPWVVGQTGSNAAPALNTMAALPFYVPIGSTTLKSLSVYCSAAPTTGYTWRAAVYADSGSGQPGALVSGSDTGNQSTGTSTGIKTATYGTAVSLTPGWYWLATQFSAGAGGTIYAAAASAAIGGVQWLTGAPTPLDLLSPANGTAGYASSGVTTYQAFPSTFANGGAINLTASVPMAVMGF